uniref:Uncharacterized protein n=1 Tax=Wolbachia endosymbiont of Aleurodicus dispersus TaxID=1288877 RepID=A0A3B0IZG0_9RICK
MLENMKFSLCKKSKRAKYISAIVLTCFIMKSFHMHQFKRKWHKKEIDNL